MKIAASALLPLILLTACNRAPDGASGGASAHQRKAEDPLEKACASSTTYDRLKALLFDEARKVGKVPGNMLDQLQASVVVRMENPVVASRDEPLTVMSCTGRFIVELPPGVTDAFDGDQRLSADIGYTIQKAADGSGLVYAVSRAEPIVYRLAAFNLPQRSAVAAPAPQPQPPVEPSEEMPNPVGPPPVQRPPAQPEPVPPAFNVARPSFDCRYARTRVERMICADPRLAALDRQMAREFENALAQADGRGARVIERSRAPFLDYREDCPDAACVAEAYRDRIDELRDYSVDQ